MALTSTAISDMAAYIKRRIGSAKYYIGATAYPAAINSITIVSAGAVRVVLAINPTSAATVTKVELYNTDGQLWATQNVSVALTESSQKILHWFDFTISEEAS